MAVTCMSRRKQRMQFGLSVLRPDGARSISTFLGTIFHEHSRNSVRLYLKKFGWRLAE